ncbi:MAG: 50S ribosomal protein L35 [Patescibacteria group bacterium]
MALKKMKSKTHKGTAKRVKVTNGGKLSKGKLLTNRINKAHRNIKKQRERQLKAKRSTVLSDVHDKLKAILY